MNNTEEMYKKMDTGIVKKISADFMESNNVSLNRYTDKDNDWDDTTKEYIIGSRKLYIYIVDRRI